MAATPSDHLIPLAPFPTYANHEKLDLLSAVHTHRKYFRGNSQSFGNRKELYILLSLTCCSLAAWLVDTFNTLLNSPLTHKFFKEARNDDWVEKLNNKRGYLADINKLDNNSGTNRLMLHSGIDKVGWASFLKLINGYPDTARSEKETETNGVLSTCSLFLFANCLVGWSSSVVVDFSLAVNLDMVELWLSSELLSIP